MTALEGISVVDLSRVLAAEAARTLVLPWADAATTVVTSTARARPIAFFIGSSLLKRCRVGGWRRIRVSTLALPVSMIKSAVSIDLSGPQSLHPPGRIEELPEADRLVALEGPDMDERNVQLFART